MTGPVEVVEEFLRVVRSGADPDAAALYLAPVVQAHQVQSEAPLTVTRTPEDYAAHVREMQATHGAFTFSVDELFGSGEKVYARWTQVGAPPSGRPVTEMASCVYRVVDGLVVEYWIQVDRFGIEAQLTG